MSERTDATRRRPWWLVAKTPGGAALYCVPWLIQVWVLISNDGRGRLGPIWLAVCVATVTAMAAASVATFISYRRHPDWVNRTWALPILGRRARLAMAAGTVVGILTAVVALVVALIIRSDIAGGIAILGILLAFVCGSQLGLLRDTTSPSPGNQPDPNVDVHQSPRKSAEP